MIINSVYSDKTGAATLRTDEEFEKMREERIKRRQRDRAMPAKPMTKFPAMSDEAFEIRKQELSAMVAKAVSDNSTMADQAFKRRKQELFGWVEHANSRNENSTLSDETTLVKRKLELSALTDKIRQEFTRSSTMSCS